MTVTHRIAVVGFVALCVLVEGRADPICLAEAFEQEDVRAVHARGWSERVKPFSPRTESRTATARGSSAQRP
ncbi:hypothetical protein BRC67_03545 [Halobacteriales archaeon QH_3_68_24]|nr:MAG: hypothetical protein BRC67_03545 [Halobacteriales archaeon QH_3_68_24]